MRLRLVPQQARQTFMTESEQRPSDSPGSDERPWLELPVSNEGVDLTQIREFLRRTPAERLELLVKSANNLIELKKNVRRV
ncbi:MAG: hypothetical protein HY791_05275 [Deltaproteobacteria bacterium]|nr:hypothetical protein [Deltaproteobacteria bacterium]